MHYIPHKTTATIILDRGEELHQELVALATEHDWTSAWIQGLGGAISATLGFYNFETREYEWKEFNEPLEILNLQGNMVIKEGVPFWHIHGVFSGRDFTAIGGHIKSLTIGLTGELHIMPKEIRLTRSYDQTTGLALICPAE